MTNYYLFPEDMRDHLTPVSTIKQESSTESYKEVTMDTADVLTNFVDLLNAPVFPPLKDFIASSSNEAINWS